MHYLGIFLLALGMPIMQAKFTSHHHLVRVYIHGTCYSELSLLNPQALRTDAFDGTTPYEQALEKSRTDGFIEQSDLILQLGLCDITQLIKNPEAKDETKLKAALHIVRAFDVVDKAYANSSAITHYYTFGWAGKMSESCRNESSQELYQELFQIKEQIETAGDTVSFELYAHSHGGQLVLYLAHVREERGDTNFVIDKAILSATPLYHTKAHYALSGMFKTIMNIYLEGDMIQRSDTISIPDDTTYSTFKEIPQMPTRHTDNILIADVRLMAHHSHDAFNHGSFTILDRSAVPMFARESAIIKCVLDTIHPLPLIVLYPVLIAELEKYCKNGDRHSYQQIDVNFTHYQDKKLIAEITPFGTTSTPEHIVNFPLPELHAVRDLTKQAYAETKYNSELNKSFHNLVYVLEIPANKMRSFVVTVHTWSKKYTDKFKEMLP